MNSSSQTVSNSSSKSMTTEGLIDLRLLSQAPCGVYAVDINRIITFWNRGAERILGYRASEAIGRRCCRVLHGLPENGSTPICVEACPAVHLTGASRFPPIAHVMARCASGRLKPITITPLIVSQPHRDGTVLVNLFHERTEAARGEATAGCKREATATGTLGPHSPDPSSREVTPLTARELQVLSLIGRGLNAREIAGKLTITNNTARNHVRNVCGKLQARSKVEAVVIAKSRNLL